MQRFYTDFIFLSLQNLIIHLEKYINKSISCYEKSINHKDGCFHQNSFAVQQRVCVEDDRQKQ